MLRLLCLGREGEIGREGDWERGRLGKGKKGERGKIFLLSSSVFLLSTVNSSFFRLPFSNCQLSIVNCQLSTVNSWHGPCKGKLVILFEVCHTTNIRDVSLKIVRFAVRTSVLKAVKATRERV